MREGLVTSRILQYRKIIPLAKRWKRDLLFCAKYFSPFASKGGERKRDRDGARKRDRGRRGRGRGSRDSDVLKSE